MLNFGKKRKNFNPSAGRYFSVSAYRSQPVRSRLVKNRSASIKLWLVRILLLLVFAGLGYLLFFSSFFRVAKFDISGNTSVNTDEVRRIAEDIAGKKAYKYFNNNLILINASEIEKAIQEKFNSIDTVAAVKRFPNELSISIVEKPADILWCNKITVEKIFSSAKNSENNDASGARENSLQEASQCYFSDKANIIYRKAPGDELPAGVKIFRDDSINIGDKIADDAVKNFILSLSGSFNSKTALEFSYLYLPPIASRELHLITKDGWKIYFDLNRDAGDQLDVLNSVWREAIPENYKNSNNIEYIDLRVPERVSWRPKNELPK